MNCDDFVPESCVLITGAAGNLGVVLTTSLIKKNEEWKNKLLLTDIKEKQNLPEKLPKDLPYLVADLGDSDQSARLEQWAVEHKCGAVVHLGAISTEQSFNAVLHANIIGTHNIYEMAAKHGWRVVYASSNHATGLHLRSEKLDADCELISDGEYGLSKAYAELLGKNFWFKRAVPTVTMRIGSCFEEPRDRRMLSTWLSFRDFVNLVSCALKRLYAGTTVDGKTLGYRIIWGTSNNTASFYNKDDRDAIGWTPLDSADKFKSHFDGKTTTVDPVAEKYQGGSFASMNNTVG